MHEIICPHCNRAFKVDESGYAEILKQVRDSDFEKQLHERLELAEREKQSAVELAKAKVSSDLHKTAVAKDAEIQELKSRLKASEVTQKLAVTEALAAVEKERDTLANALAQAEREKKFAMTEAVGTVEKERDELKSCIKQVQLERQLAEQSLKDKYEAQIKDRDDAIER